MKELRDFINDESGQHKGEAVAAMCAGMAGGAKKEKMKRLNFSALSN